MTLTVTDRGVAQTTAGGSITCAVTSAAFSPAAGTILVALISEQVKNDSGASTDVTFVLSDTIGDTAGGSWTQQAVCTRGNVTSFQYSEKTEIWTRIIGTTPGASKTVTATGSYNAGANTTSTDGWVWLNTVEVAGQNASPIGGTTGSTSRQAAGPTTLVLTPSPTPLSTSAVFTVIQDDTTNSTPTTPSGYTLLNEDHPASGFADFAAAYINTGAGSTTTWTGLNATHNYLGSALEILVSAAADDALLNPLPHQLNVYRM